MYVDRIPPHDEEAEEAVLGSLIIDGAVIVRVAPILQPADFYRERNRWTYEACLAIFDRSEAIDQVSVAHQLGDQGRLEESGSAAFLSHLVATVPTSVHAEHYAAIVRRTSTMRSLIRAGTEIAGLGFGEDGDVVGALRQAEDLLFRVRGRQEIKDYVSLRDILDQYMEESASIQAPTPGTGPVPTGFLDLDRLLGGLHRGSLNVLAARPGIGKSTLAMNMGRYAAGRGNRVGLASLEMGRMELAFRLLAAEGEVDSHRLRLSLITEREQMRVINAVGGLSDLLIYIDDTPGQPISEIRSRARRLQMERGLDLLIVDYIQLVHGTRRHDNWEMEMSEISGALKEMAQEMEIPVVAISQLSRAVEQRPSHRPVLSDLRDSGTIEQDADVVLFIYRDDATYTEETWGRMHPTEPYPKNIAEVIVAKHRNGPVGEAQLYFRSQFSRFENMVAQVDLDREGQA